MRNYAKQFLEANEGKCRIYIVLSYSSRLKILRQSGCSLAESIARFLIHFVASTSPFELLKNAVYVLKATEY